MEQGPIEVPRGLAGVVVTDTALGDVRGREGFYHYRQYSAVELAERRSFEDVWHLMFHGELPDAPAARGFTTRTARLRHLPARRTAGAARYRPGDGRVRAAGRAAHRALPRRCGGRVPSGLRPHAGRAPRGRAGGLRRWCRRC